jgi:hypothetical protein
MSNHRISRTSRTERYVIDGKEYDKLDEIPEAERRKLEAHLSMLADRDGDGVPDILQGRDAIRSEVKTRTFHYASTDADNADQPMGELLAKLLKGLGTQASDGEASGGARHTQLPESPQLRREREDRRRARLRYTFVIVILLAIIGYVLLAPTL